MEKKKKKKLKEKIEFYQTIQQIFQMLGIDLMQTIPAKYFLNVQNLRCILIYGSGTVSSFYYTFNLIDTFEEYISSFYVLSSMVICLTLYSFLVWNTGKLSEIFAKMRTIIQESECINFLCELTGVS